MEYSARNGSSLALSSPMSASISIIPFANESFSEPIDFSTKRQRIPSPESRNPWMTSPESGVSSMGAGSPVRSSPEIESPPKALPPLFPLIGMVPSPPLNNQKTPEMKLREGENHFESLGPFGTFPNANSNPIPGMSSQGMDCGYNPQMIPQVSALLAQFQSNPLLVSTLYNIATQKLQAEMSGSSVRPPTFEIPHMQQQQPNIPFMAAQTPQVPFPPQHPLGGIQYPPYGTAGVFNVLEDAQSNEAYQKFRDEMKARRKIGTKPRRSRNRSGLQANVSPANDVDGEMSTEEGNAHDRCTMNSSGSDSTQNGSQDPAKDEAYWERRRKNNEAAKRSRDARRAKEDEIAVRAAYLETENLQLKMQISELKRNIRQLIAIKGLPADISVR